MLKKILQAELAMLVLVAMPVSSINFPIKSAADVATTSAPVLTLVQAKALSQQATNAVVAIYGKEVVQEAPDPILQMFAPFFSQQPIQAIKTIAGTGFFANPNGYILTANHVVSDNAATYSVVLSSGEEKTMRIVYQDPAEDVAILKIDGSNYPVLNLGSSTNLRSGQQVIGIGEAYGSYMTSSLGEVSSGGQDVTLAAVDESGEPLPQHLMQSSMQLYPGQSGGPTLDSSGNVVGINDAIATDISNVSLSVPIDYAKADLQTALGL